MEEDDLFRMTPEQYTQFERYLRMLSTPQVAAVLLQAAYYRNEHAAEIARKELETRK